MVENLNRLRGGRRGGSREWSTVRGRRQSEEGADDAPLQPQPVWSGFYTVKVRGWSCETLRGGDFVPTGSHLEDGHEPPSPHVKEKKTWASRSSIRADVRFGLWKVRWNRDPLDISGTAISESQLGPQRGNIRWRSRFESCDVTTPPPVLTA